jgi:hypothetical protein
LAGSADYGVRPRAGVDGLLSRLRSTFTEVEPGVAVEEEGTLERLVVRRSTARTST